MMGRAEDGDICPFHENVDPNERYELIQLLGEGSYGSVYKGGSVHSLPSVRTHFH